MTNFDFILDFQKKDYPYLEEINEGILKQVEPDFHHSNILDVGAGRGILGEALSNLGYTVYAIESDEVAAAEAKQRVSHVIKVDLHDITKVVGVLKEKKFKYIIFSDILEHVFDPLQVLRSYLQFLAEDGKILISLPNAVNWLNRLRFMFGSFNYEMTGVMDRTHIRFFTYKSATKMLEACQCKIVKIDSTPFLTRAFLPIIKRCLNKNKDNNPKIVLESPYYKIYQKFVYPVEYWLTRLFPALCSFRMIFVVRK